jgi:Fe-S cluster biogenesis protein NfuA
MEEFVKKVIAEQIRPSLQAHGGDIEFIGLDDGAVRVRLRGACATCPGAQQTLSELVEGVLKEACPTVKRVIPITGVGEELINEALKILRRERGNGR